MAIRNPILPGCNPDPSFRRVGADYHNVATTFELYPDEHASFRGTRITT